jgi:hypothetical protein
MQPITRETTGIMEIHEMSLICKEEEKEEEEGGGGEGGGRRGRNRNKYPMMSLFTLYDILNFMMVKFKFQLVFANAPFVIGSASRKIFEIMYLDIARILPRCFFAKLFI